MAWFAAGLRAVSKSRNVLDLLTRCASTCDATRGPGHITTELEVAEKQPAAGGTRPTVDGVTAVEIRCTPAPKFTCAFCARSESASISIPRQP